MKPMTMVEPVLLVGEHVRLEPLGVQHADGIARAAADGAVWRKWTTTVPAPDDVAAEIHRRVAADGVVAWATCLPDGTPVGMTTYLNLDEPNRRLEIGSTWLGASAQRTLVNPEAKLLQLTRAFDVLRFTDDGAALVGASHDGRVLRWNDDLPRDAAGIRAWVTAHHQPGASEGRIVPGCAVPSP